MVITKMVYMRTNTREWRRAMGILRHHLSPPDEARSARCLQVRTVGAGHPLNLVTRCIRVCTSILSGREPEPAPPRTACNPDGEVAGKVGVDEGGRVPLVFKVAHGRVGEGKVVCGGGQRQGRCVGTVEHVGVRLYGGVGGGAMEVARVR